MAMTADKANQMNTNINKLLEAIEVLAKIQLKQAGEQFERQLSEQAESLTDRLQLRVDSINKNIDKNTEANLIGAYERYQRGLKKAEECKHIPYLYERYLKNVESSYASDCRAFTDIANFTKQANLARVAGFKNKYGNGL